MYSTKTYQWWRVGSIWLRWEFLYLGHFHHDASQGTLSCLQTNKSLIEFLMVWERTIIRHCAFILVNFPYAFNLVFRVQRFSLHTFNRSWVHLQRLHYPQGLPSKWDHPLFRNQSYKEVLNSNLPLCHHPIQVLVVVRIKFYQTTRKLSNFNFP